MKRIKGNISSQKSPREACYRLGKKDIGFYPCLLFQDFSISFSGEFGCKVNDDFYCIYPQNDSLEHLLTFQNYQFLRYEFDDILGKVARGLLWADKAFLEMALWKNENNDVTGITFEEIVPIVSWRGLKFTYFISLSHVPPKIRYFRVPNEFLITFCTKDLGLSNFYFRKLVWKLKWLDIFKNNDLITRAARLNYDITEHDKKVKLRLLKIAKEIGWIGRAPDNPFLSESHLLLRIARYREFKRNLLQYAMKKINQALNEHRDDVGYKGRIVVNTAFTNYKQGFDKLWAGKLTTSQLSKIVI